MKMSINTAGVSSPEGPQGVSGDTPGRPDSPNADHSEGPTPRTGISMQSSKAVNSKNRVPLACHACRFRKIKCDAKQPTCTICSRNERACIYDDGPKRRGPDRRPRAQRPRRIAPGSHVTSAATPRSPSHSDTDRSTKGSLESMITMQTTLASEGRQPALGNMPLDPAPIRQFKHPAHGGDSETSASVPPMADRTVPGVYPMFDSFDLSARVTTTLLHQCSPESLSPQNISPLGSLQPGPSNLNHNFSFALDSSISPMNSYISDPLPLKFFAFDSGPSTDSYDNHNTFPGTVVPDLSSQSSSSSPVTGTKSPATSQTSYDSTASMQTPSFMFQELAEYGDYYVTDDSGNEQAVSAMLSPSFVHPPESSPKMTSQPSLDFSRQIWWDQLLTYYDSDRAIATARVVDELKHLFRASNHLVSFIHVPLFFAALRSPTEREFIQPSLIFAALALSMFLKSSDLELGAKGRTTALWLRDQAQAALEASLNSGFITPGLTQAALVCIHVLCDSLTRVNEDFDATVFSFKLLVVFEASGHPQHSTSRCASSLALLDSIITSLGLLDMDASEPDVSHFARHTVPSIPMTETHLNHLHMMYPANSSVVADGGCSCSLFQIETTSPDSKTLTPSWLTCPGWNSGWSLADTRKEEQRRVVWCALALAGGCITYWMSQGGGVFDFNVWKPWKYHILFPGEALYRSKSTLNDRSPKDTIWALYARCQLLYASCLDAQKDNTLDDVQRGQFAVQAWLEAERLEAALDTHSCKFEQSSLYHGREFLFNTQNLVSFQFKRYVPHPHLGDMQFNRQKAEAWLHHRRRVATYITHGLNIITGHDNDAFSHRPIFQFHMLGMGAQALEIWQQDQGILIALELSKSLLPAIEYLGTIFPSEVQQMKYRTLRHRLAQACIQAGIPPPPP
ncbi:hypothetical protein BS47DRAFT_1315770, partial [Hydnum rufescens UP504]